MSSNLSYKLTNPKVILFLYEANLSSLLQYFRRHLHEAEPIQRAWLPCPPPAPMPDYEAMLGFPVAFENDRWCIEFPAEFLDRKLTTANPLAEAVLEKMCAEALAQGRPTRTLSRLRDILFFECKRGRILTQPEAANMLGMSLRTLSRELSSLQTSHQEVLDEVRAQLAIRCLSIDGKTVAETAYFLGFNDLSNFSKAFRRWTGMGPGHFRKGRNLPNSTLNRPSLSAPCASPANFYLKRFG